jgi:hypothetical protein
MYGKNWKRPEGMHCPRVVWFVDEMLSKKNRLRHVELVLALHSRFFYGDLLHKEQSRLEAGLDYHLEPLKRFKGVFITLSKELPMYGLVKTVSNQFQPWIDKFVQTSRARVQAIAEGVMEQ